MKDLKFTPAPWRVATKEDNKHLSNDYNGVIALDGPRTNSPGFSITGCIGIDDAKLIASAPDMYALLKEAKECLEWIQLNPQVLTDPTDTNRQASLNEIKQVLSKINKLFES